MEMSEQAISALKQKMQEALESERKSLLGFAAGNRAGVDQIYQALLEQAEETAGYYPEFDLKAELEGEEFMTLLRAGFPIRRAYEAVHHQQLVEAALHYGAAHALPPRPAENGLSGQTAAAAPGSMAHSTRAQREDIRSRVSRGETVRL